LSIHKARSLLFNSGPGTNQSNKVLAPKRLFASKYLTGAVQAPYVFWPQIQAAALDREENDLCARMI